jgi:integrase
MYLYTLLLNQLSTTTMPQGWYWLLHGDEYERHSVEEIQSFCGWEVLLQLIKECARTPYNVSPFWKNEDSIAEYRRKKRARDQGIIATLFETGGRINEVLALKKDNFDFSHPDFIRVAAMPLLKRYKRDKTTGEIHSIPSTRTFVIPSREPLVQYMKPVIDRADPFLFPSPKYPDRPMTDTRAYQIVRDLGERIGMRIWNHWFRAQRASQLASEYNFDVPLLLRFFNWKSYDTALRYARLGVGDLMRAMNPESLRFPRSDTAS